MSPDEGPPRFQRLSRQVLVENSWHRYCLDRYTRSDGSEGRYYYIDVPGSVGIIPLFEDGSTILLKQRRYLLGQDLWEFPIGGMAEGDDPLWTGRNELREEAGLAAGRWDYLGKFAPYKGVSNEHCHFYLARDLEAVEREPAPEEQISVHRFPLLEAREILLDQDLGDGQSWCGLLLLDRFPANG